MTDLRAHATVALLASDLGVDAERIASLERLGTDYLHELRGAVSASLYDAHVPVFRRISRLAPLVPNPVLAKLVPALVPPLVAGYAAGALALDHPGRIDDLLPRLPAPYLAACARYLDLRVVERLAPTIHPDLILPAARQLLADGEYAVAAGFVEYATPALIEAFEQGIDDDLGIIRTASCVYSDTVIDDIVKRLPDARLVRLFRAGLGDAPTVASALVVASRLSPQTKQNLVRRLKADVGDEFDDVLTNVAEEAGQDASVVTMARVLLRAA